MLSGEQAHSLDEKNRIRIPAKFKDDLGKNFVFCKGSTPCIYVLPQKAFDELAQGFSKISFFDEEAQGALSEFMSSFYPAEEDKYGRILIPQPLREYAHIDKNVVTVGVYNRLEIWSEELRAERRTKMSFADQMKVLASRTNK